VVASTASPFKFCDAVLHALGVGEVRTGVDALDQLTEVTGIAGPVPLTSLRTKTPRFDGSVEKTQLLETVKEFLQ
jgi:threonine synthase